MVSSASNLRSVGNLNKYKLQISLHNAISTTFVETLSPTSVIYMCKKNLQCVVNFRFHFACVRMKILIYNVKVKGKYKVKVHLRTGHVGPER